MGIKAPFPWFGGKSRVATLVWKRFGNVPNYIEPFAGSLAVLLGRKTPPGLETVNDIDCHISNFWRSISHSPDKVAQAADWPVNEADLLARHEWLLAQTEFQKKIRTDPEFFDEKIAGWWVWGICAWIGGGWCIKTAKQQLPHLSSHGQGIHKKKLPHLSGGRGVNRNTLHSAIPTQNADAMGQEQLKHYFTILAARLRKVRVCCGDWSRVLGESVTIKNGITGVFLDPPYAATNRSTVYATDTPDVATDVQKWAIANGDNPLYRIALCGYAGDYDMPKNWTEVPWKAAGGFGSQGNGKGRENSAKERVWFSPHCKSATLLFGDEGWR